MDACMDLWMDGWVDGWVHHHLILHMHLPHMQMFGCISLPHTVLLNSSLHPS